MNRRYLSIGIAVAAAFLLMIGIVPTAEARETFVSGHTEREGSGLILSLQSDVWLPELYLEFYSHDRGETWQLDVDEETLESGDFQEGHWDELETELPGGRLHVRFRIGDEVFTWSITVRERLEDSDEIETEPETVELLKSELMSLRWWHAFHGAGGVSISFIGSYFVLKYRKTEKWGDLVR